MGKMKHLVRKDNIFVLFQYVLNSIIEVRIANTRAVKSWEKVSDQTKEQRDILIHKLWQIHVSESAHQHHVLLNTEMQQLNDKGIQKKPKSNKLFVDFSCYIFILKILNFSIQGCMHLHRK